MGLQTPQRLPNGKHFHVCWKPSELLSCVSCYIQYVHASVCNPCWHRGESKQECGQVVGKPAREHISLTPRPYWVFCVFTRHLPRSPPSPTARETGPRQEPACLQYLKLPSILCTVKARMGEEKLGSAPPTTSLWKGLKVQGGWSEEEEAEWAGRGKTWRNLEDVCRLPPTGLLRT